MKNIRKNMQKSQIQFLDVCDLKNAKLKNISFSLKKVKISGLESGLMGAGRTELARAIFGADPIDSRRDLYKWDQKEYANISA